MFWFYFSIGLTIGFIGEHLNWGIVKTIVVCTLVALAFVFLTPSNSEAAEAYQPKLRNATAHIQNGSGFLLKAPSGKIYLVTNAHVCLQGSWLGTLAGSLESGQVIRGKIVKKSLAPDICAASAEGRELAPLDISRTLRPLENIHTRGYPYHVLSESNGRFRGKVTWEADYEISEVGECPKFSQKLYSGTGTLTSCRVQYKDNITDLYSRPGSSGSPVVNSNGELVGIISSWDSKDDFGGMVKLEDIKEFFKDL